MSEATIWNLAFWDGETVLWPRADILPGVTMQVLARRLADHGIPQQTREITEADLSEELSAVVMNSWTPGIAVSCLGDRDLSRDTALTEILHRVYATEVPQGL